jgi:Zn-finger nucleic acid-binding protein
MVPGFDRERRRRRPMECPVCGCHVDADPRAGDFQLVTCACCDAVWLVVRDELERILVGTED